MNERRGFIRLVTAHQFELLLQIRRQSRSLADGHRRRSYSIKLHKLVEQFSKIVKL